MYLTGGCTYLGVGRAGTGDGTYLLQGTGFVSQAVPGWVWLSLSLPDQSGLAPFKPQDPAILSPSFRAVRVDNHTWGGSA